MKCLYSTRGNTVFSSRRLRLGSVPGKIIAGQIGVALCAAALYGLVAGKAAAQGALAGGGISVLLNVWMAFRVFSVSAAASPQKALSTFVGAEIGKLAIAFVLFSAAAVFFSHVLVPLVVTFVATLAVHWLALVFTRYDRQGFGG